MAVSSDSILTKEHRRHRDWGVDCLYWHSRRTWAKDSRTGGRGKEVRNMSFLSDILCMCMLVSIHACVCMSVCVHLSMCLCGYMCVSMCLFSCVFVHVYVCVYICPCVCVCICLWVCVCLYLNSQRWTDPVKADWYFKWLCYLLPHCFPD